ncbi:MAG TPA: hypothetical protein VKV26_04065 [Dehalococcoidia bacterium]|nr:hypothetical protein [Dehalococcoidia bacterium]
MRPFRVLLVAGAAALTASLLPAIAFALPAASAQSLPPAGRLYGFVQVDDHGAYDATTVIAHVNGSICGQASYDANRGLYIIDLDSSIAECAQAGNVVWFSVGPCTAYTTGTVPEFSGAEQVDLIAPGRC